MVSEKKQEVSTLDAAFQEIRDKHKRLEEKTKSDEELLQSLLTGLGGSNNTGGGYRGQLSEANTRLAQATTEEKQATFKLGVAQNELKDLEKKMKEFESQAAENKSTLAKMEKAVKDKQKDLANLNWSEEKEQELTERLNVARQAVRQLAEVSSLICIIDLS